MLTLVEDNDASGYFYKKECDTHCKLHRFSASVFLPIAERLLNLENKMYSLPENAVKIFRDIKYGQFPDDDYCHECNAFLSFLKAMGALSSALLHCIEVRMDINEEKNEFSLLVRECRRF